MTRAALHLGPLGRGTAHLCVDMQNLFAEPGAWHVPRMKAVLPRVLDLGRAQAAATIFTRFIPAETPATAPGAWRGYYQRWRSVTLDRLDPAMIELMPELAAWVPPAQVFDKATYGPWQDGTLHRRLLDRGIDTLVITGGETDVCVLGAVLGAVDLGYRVVLVEDALCSSSDVSHDAMMTIYRDRFTEQIETASTAQVLAAWS